jgi:hypothetical protein
MKGVAPLIKDIAFDALLADKAFDADWLLQDLNARGATAVLEAMRGALHLEKKPPPKLGAGGFPIIFIPNPGGGDLQVTPASPATAFKGMKRVTDPYF